MENPPVDPHLPMQRQISACQAAQADTHNRRAYVCTFLYPSQALGPVPVIDIDPLPVVDIDPLPVIDINPLPVIDIDPLPVIEIGHLPVIDIGAPRVIDVFLPFAENIQTSKHPLPSLMDSRMFNSNPHQNRHPSGGYKSPCPSLLPVPIPQQIDLAILILNPQAPR